jgi:hypothetical protein
MWKVRPYRAILLKEGIPDYIVVKPSFTNSPYAAEHFLLQRSTMESATDFRGCERTAPVFSRILHVSTGVLSRYPEGYTNLFVE